MVQHKGVITSFTCFNIILLFYFRFKLNGVVVYLEVDDTKPVLFLIASVESAEFYTEFYKEISRENHLAYSRVM